MLRGLAASTSHMQPAQDIGDLTIAGDIVRSAAFLV